MAQRTLAEAVAEIRLSDRKLTGDLATLRQRLIQAAQQIEKDVQVNVSFKLDDRKVAADVAKLKQTVSSVQPVIAPVVEPNAEKRVADRLSKIRAEVGLTGDPAPLLATARSTADKIRDLRVAVGLDADPGPAYEAIDRTGEYAEQTLPAYFDDAGEKSGNSFGSALKSSFKGIAATVGVAAGGFIATALVTGFQRLTTIEDATAALTVQLGSAAEAAELLGEVLDVVRGTPFNLDQFAKAAADMVAFGVETRKIPTYLRAIGEAAASQGGRASEVAGRLSLIFGQITTANRIGGEELLQFSEAGVNALAILGNAFGKTTTEIRELVSEGAIPAKQALDILSKGIMEGSTGIAGTTVAFEGTMAKLRETLTGSIGGFKAATARFGVELIKPFEEGMIAAFQGATAAIDDLGKRAKAAFSGIADSDFFAGLVDALRGLPEIVDQVVGALGKLGPAMAPLLAFVGASGLGAVLGLIPGLGSVAAAISPVTAAIGALIAFTPDLREEFLPVLQKIVGIVMEFGAVAGVAAGKIGEALVPIGAKLIAAFGQLVPVAEALKNFGEGLLAVVVPAIQALSDVISKIPVPVITALVTAFLGFKLVTPVFGPLNTAARLLMTTFTLTGSSVENAATKAKSAMSGMYVAVAGAFSGMALASRDSAQQIVGAIGSIGSIAAGFAMGPWAGAAATLGVALGAVTGHFVEQARAAAENKRQIDALSKSYTDQTLELIKDNDALTTWLKLSTEARGSAALGAQFLDTSTEAGKENAEMLRDLGLASTGRSGETMFGRLLEDLDRFNSDVSKSPELMAALTEQFGGQADAVADVITKYQAAGLTWKDLQADIGRSRVVGQATSGQFIGVTNEELKAISDTLGPSGELRGRADATFEAIFKVLNVVADPGSNPTKVIRESFEELLATSPAVKAAIDLITGGQKNLNIESKSYSEIRALIDRAIQIAAGKDEEFSQARLNRQQVNNLLLDQEFEKVTLLEQARQGLAAGMRELGSETAKVTQENIDNWQKLADEIGISVLDVIPEDLLAFIPKDLQDSIRAGGELGEVLEGLAPPITEAEIAAKNLAAAVLLSAAAARQVGIEIDKLKGKLSDRLDTAGLIGSIRNVQEGFSKIINESDLKKAEGLNKSLADTQERIRKLQVEVNEEADKAAAEAVDLGIRIEEARAAGAVGGVALLENELKHVGDAAAKKQEQLDKAIADAREKSGELSKLGAAPISFLEQLKAQAQERGLTLIDMLLQQPTEESAQAFNSFIAPAIQNVTDAFVTELEKHPENASQLAIFYRQVLTDALLKGGLPPEVVQQLVNQFFGPTDTGAVAKAAKEAAKRQHDIHIAELVKLYEDDPDIAKLVTKLFTVPPGSEAAQSIFDSIQLEADKHAISLGVEPEPLTAADIAHFATLEGSAVVALDVVDLTAGVVNLSVTGEPPTVNANLNTSPASRESTAKAAQETQDLLDEQAELEKQLAVLPPDSPRYAEVVAEIQANLDAQEAAKVQVGVKFDATSLTGKALEQYLRDVVGIRVPVSVVVAPAVPRDRSWEGAEGGILDPAHVAQIVSAGAYRVFAEPETHGEGYIPLSPFKRTRSLGIMAEIADIFGYQLEPKARPAATPMPLAMTGGRGAVSTLDADLIGRAVAAHTKPSASDRAHDFALAYEQGVHFEQGAIVVQGAPTPRRTAAMLVSRLADLAIRRR